MNISTEPTINLHLILTGDEARAFLADPRPLQSLVRDELAKQHRRNVNESAAVEKRPLSARTLVSAKTGTRARASPRSPATSAAKRF